MADRNLEKKVQEEHFHSWTLSPDQTEERCSCRKLRVLRAEFDRRANEWTEYNRMVTTTQSYLDYQDMKIAFAYKDIAKIREIEQRIMQRNNIERNELGDEILTPKDDYDWLPKPPFPDPRHGTMYLIREESVN